MMSCSSSGLLMWSVPTLLGLLWIPLTTTMMVPENQHPPPFGGEEPPFPIMPGNISRLSRGFDLSADPDPDPDTTYCQMLLEGPEVPPIQNIPWFCVCSHCKGTVGPKGDRGDRGLPGSPGSPGPRGFTGFRGRPGFMGRMGLKGQKGDNGEKGDQGLRGNPGPKGDRGFKGDQGEPGVEGPPGEQGPQGEEGQCPGNCETLPGPPGDPGLPGPAGARGLPGLAGAGGAPGMKGEKGNAGAPGLPGPLGQKGDQGAEGECHCEDGQDGKDGDNGDPGPKGSHGETGPPGETGPVGEKGEKGDLGMMGPPGPCSPAIQSAFSAALDFLYPPPDLPVPFTRIIYNMQGHFSPLSGIYTAPVNGTYVFSYYLVVFSRTLKVGLFVNFRPIVKSTESTDLTSASHQVVLHLKEGDRVWLQVKDNNSNGMYTSSESSSTFSGFLLHPDNCDMPLFRGFITSEVGDPIYSWDGPSSTPVPTTEP